MRFGHAFSLTKTKVAGSTQSTLNFPSTTDTFRRPGKVNALAEDHVASLCGSQIICLQTHKSQSPQLNNALYPFISQTAISTTSMSTIVIVKNNENDVSGNADAERDEDDT